MVEWSTFVEGKTTGVVLRDDGATVDILLINRSGDAYKLVATGVEQMVVIEMRLQNIIDRISIWDSSSNVVDFEERLRLLLHGSQQEDVRYAAAVTGALESLRQGRTKFLEIEPVYGALVLLIASEVKLEVA